MLAAASVCLSVCLSICLSITLVIYVKTAEPTELVFATKVTLGLPYTVV